MNICRSSAHKSAQKEKYLEYQKSLTPFFALITKEHFGQISKQSVKYIYPINSLEARKFMQNKARVLDSKSFESLSHLIKAPVNRDRPPTNKTRASDPPSARNKNSPLNSRENDEKSFWENSKGKTHKSAKEKKSCDDLQRTKHPVNRARSKKHGRCLEFARLDSIFKFLPPAFIEQIFAVLLFLLPVFLTKFCPRRLLSFR